MLSTFSTSCNSWLSEMKFENSRIHFITLVTCVTFDQAMKVEKTHVNSRLSTI